nr:hypothetical protein [Paenibacillus larvae]
MVKRKSYRIYMYLIFAVLVMMMCWDANRTNAAVLGAPIPQDSIRLRILANSDKVQIRRLNAGCGMRLWPPCRHG